MLCSKYSSRYNFSASKIISYKLLSIFFKKASQSIKEQAIYAIVEVFSENNNYLFEISGVDVDRFVEDSYSKKYLLKTDKRHRFIKNLPELFLFSHHLEDANLFGQYIGSFNEGYMYLHILKRGIAEICNEQSVLNFVQENKLLTIEVVSDGDLVNVSCNDKEKTKLIRRYLENKIPR